MWIILNFFVFFKVLILLSMYPTCIEECHLIFRYCIQHLLAAAESIEWRIPAFLFRLSLIQGPRIVPIVVLYCFFLIFWFPFSLSLSWCSLVICTCHFFAPRLSLEKIDFHLANIGTEKKIENLIYKKILEIWVARFCFILFWKMKYVNFNVRQIRFRASENRFTFKKIYC